MRSQPSATSRAIFAGFTGSLVMTLTHETARRLVPQAPRLDTLGRRGLARLIRGVDMNPPDQDHLQKIALAGDLVFNAGLFTAAVLAGSPRSAPVRGAVVGALAGLATLALPPKLSLGPGAGELPGATQAMTIGFYAGGGLVAGLLFRRADAARGS